MSLGYPAISRVTGTVGTEAAQAITVNLQVWSEAEDQVPTTARYVTLYLSTDAAGQALEVATSAMAAGTDGTLILVDTGVTHAVGITEADGDLDVVVTDTGTTAIYLNVVANGERLASFLLPFA
jgi:hypothetical protein